MWRKIIGVLIARSVGGVALRLLISLGLAAVSVNESGQEIITIHPVVIGLAVAVNIISWIAFVGSFIVVTIDLIRHW